MLRMPAFVAGFTRVLMRQSPGIVKMPFFFSSNSSARAFVIAPLVMAFELVFMLAAFMAFMAFIAFIAFIGAILMKREEGHLLDR